MNTRGDGRSVGRSTDGLEVIGRSAVGRSVAPGLERVINPRRDRSIGAVSSAGNCDGWLRWMVERARSIPGSDSAWRVGVSPFEGREPIAGGRFRKISG